MRKLLFAGLIAATPLVGWQAASAATAPATAPAVSSAVATTSMPAVQNVVWVWVNGRRVWRHPFVYRRAWVRGHFVPGHWRYGYWIPRHWVPGHWA